MKQRYILSCVLVAVLVLTGCSQETSTTASQSVYQYKTADDVKTAIETNQDKIILDIQTLDDFDKHHLKGAVATYAYPVKSDEDKAKIDSVMPMLTADNKPVYIMCPRGKGGAEKTYQYLKEKGISEDRLFIIEKGQEGWPYDGLVEKKS